MRDMNAFSTPVNKTASLVVGQAGCEDDQSLEDQKDCLVRAVKQIEQEILSLPKKHHIRKRLGQRKFELTSQLKIINKALKKKGVQSKELNDYLLDECKKTMTRAAWTELLIKAENAKKQADERSNREIDFLLNSQQ